MRILLVSLIIVCVLFSCDENKSTSKLLDEKYLYPVRIGSLWGYIDRNGKLIVGPKYTSAGFFVENHALVSSENVVKLIDIHERELLKFTEENLLSPLDLNIKALKIEKFDTVFLYNPSDGKQILAQSKQEYHYVSNSVNCNRILTSSMKAFRYLDSRGKVKLEFNRGMPSDFDEETALAAIFFTNKTCFIDTLGKMKFCFKDEGQNGFSSGLALIENGAEKFFINKFGKKVLDVSHYDNVSPFINDMATIGKAGKSGCIDKTGRLVIPLIYETVDFFSSDVIVVQPTKKNVFYFVDKNNQRIMDEEFDYIESPGFIRDLAWVKKGNKQGWINKKGEFVWSEDNK